MQARIRGTFTAADGTLYSFDAPADGGTPGPNLAPVAFLGGPGPLHGDAPLTVSFDASRSHDPDGDPLRYGWNLGDGSGAVGPTVSHTYARAGSYVVVLTVTDDAGGKGTAAVRVTVTEPAPPPSSAGLKVSGNRLIGQDGVALPTIRCVEQYNGRGATVTDVGFPASTNMWRAIVAMKANYHRYLPTVYLKRAGTTQDVATDPILHASPVIADGYWPPPDGPGNPDRPDLFTGTGLAEMVAYVNRCLNAGLIAELAPAGGKSVAFYLRDDVRAALAPLMPYIVVHLGENYDDSGFDDGGAGSAKWATTSIRDVKALRLGGYTCPIVVMANNGGRNVTTILTRAADVLAADPLHNLIFGWQCYWDGTLDQTTEQTVNGVKQGYYQKLCGISIRQAFDAIQNRADLMVMIGVCGNPGALGGPVPLAGILTELGHRPDLHVAYWCVGGSSGAITDGPLELTPDVDPAIGRWNAPDAGDPTDGKLIADWFKAHSSPLPVAATWPHFTP